MYSVVRSNLLAIPSAIRSIHLSKSRLELVFLSKMHFKDFFISDRKSLEEVVIL